MDATITRPTSAGATVQLRVNAQTKTKSFWVFQRHGLTMTDGIRIYLERVASMWEIPFSMNIPNLETEAAIDDVRSGKIYTAKTKTDLFSQLRA